MAYLRSKSSEKFRSRRVWGQRPGQPDNCNAVFLCIRTAETGRIHSEAAGETSSRTLSKNFYKNITNNAKILYIFSAKGGIMHITKSSFDRNIKVSAGSPVGDLAKEVIK